MLSEFLGFKNDYYSGLVKTVLKSGNYYSTLVKENDVALLLTTTRSYRSTLPPMVYVYEKMYMVLPNKTSVSSTFFIDLFLPSLWSTIFGVYSILIVFLIIYNRYYKHNFNQYCESVFNIIGISSEQFNFQPFSLSVTIMIYTILFYIIGEFFTAFLTTKLAMSSDFPIENLNDLLLQHNYKLCTLPYTQSRYILSSDNRFEDLLDGHECEQLRHSILSRNSLQLLKNVCDNPYLVIMAPAVTFETVIKYYYKLVKKLTN